MSNNPNDISSVDDSICPTVNYAPKLTKTILRQFIQWTSSRFNDYRKDQIVEKAHDILTSGERVTIFTCGVYSARSDGAQFGAYLINGPEHYIARGYGSSVNNFREHDRIQFAPMTSGK